MAHWPPALMSIWLNCWRISVAWPSEEHSMSQLIDLKVPDIGDFSEVPVIEVFVKPGDVIKIDDALVTLESDKATMDVPASAAGTVKEVLVKLGDKIGEGTVVVRVEASDRAAAAPAASAPAAATPAAAAPAPQVPA